MEDTDDNTPTVAAPSTTADTGASSISSSKAPPPSKVDAPQSSVKPAATEKKKTTSKTKPTKNGTKSSTVRKNNSPPPPVESFTSTSFPSPEEETGRFPSDVVCGPATDGAQHEGNKVYRRLLKEHPRGPVPKAAEVIVNAVLTKKGRFIRYDKNRQVWLDIGYDRAIEKTAKALRKSRRTAAKKLALQKELQQEDEQQQEATGDGGKGGEIAVTQAVGDLEVGHSKEADSAGAAGKASTKKQECAVEAAPERHNDNTPTSFLSKTAKALRKSRQTIVKKALRKEQQVREEQQHQQEATGVEKGGGAADTPTVRASKVDPSKEADFSGVAGKFSTKKREGAVEAAPKIPTSSMKSPPPSSSVVNSKIKKKKKPVAQESAPSKKPKTRSQSEGGAAEEKHNDASTSLLSTADVAVATMAPHLAKGWSTSDPPSSSAKTRRSVAATQPGIAFSPHRQASEPLTDEQKKPHPLLMGGIPPPPPPLTEESTTSSGKIRPKRPATSPGIVYSQEQSTEVAAAIKVAPLSAAYGRTTSEGSSSSAKTRRSVRATEPGIAFSPKPQALEPLAEDGQNKPSSLLVGGGKDLRRSTSQSSTSSAKSRRSAPATQPGIAFSPHPQPLEPLADGQKKPSSLLVGAMDVPALPLMDEPDTSPGIVYYQEQSTEVAAAAAAAAIKVAPLSVAYGRTTSEDSSSAKTRRSVRANEPGIAFSPKPQALEPLADDGQNNPSLLVGGGKDLRRSISQSSTSSAKSRISAPATEPGISFSPHPRPLEPLVDGQIKPGPLLVGGILPPPLTEVSRTSSGKIRPKRLATSPGIIYSQEQSTEVPAAIKVVPLSAAYGRTTSGGSSTGSLTKNRRSKPAEQPGIMFSSETAKYSAKFDDTYNQAAERKGASSFKVRTSVQDSFQGGDPKKDGSKFDDTCNQPAEGVRASSFKVEASFQDSFQGGEWKEDSGVNSTRDVNEMEQYGGLITATLAEEHDVEALLEERLAAEKENQVVAEAEVFDEAKLERGISRRKQLKYMSICGVVSLVIILSLALTRDFSSSYSPARIDAFSFMLQNVSGEVIFDESSPQYLAVNWIANEDSAMLDIETIDPWVLTERYIVALFFFATEGKKWRKPFNFLEESNVCSWNEGGSGVLCEEDGSISGIRLASNLVGGGLPSELALLTKLESLFLAKNRLESTVPFELGSLPLLRELRLDENSITGDLSSTFCQGREAIVEELYADCGAPPAEVTCSCCRQCCTDGLGCTETRFAKFRPFLEPFSGDTILDSTSPQYAAWDWLTNHDESGSLLELPPQNPAVLVYRYVLATLYFATDGPNWVNQLNFLSNSSHCEWNTGSDDTVGVKSGVACNPGVSDLQVFRLNLVGNNLAGTIPLELGLFGRDGVVGSNFEFLELQRNNLQGTIPGELSSLADLSNLHLFQNRLSGTIPKALADLNSLREFKVYENALTGTLPSSIGDLSNLRIFQVHENQLSGTIPSELGQLSLAFEFTLFNNRLTGTVPTEVGFLTRLEVLDLSSNALNGRIPSEIAKLTNLQNLELDENAISGSIPSQIGLLTKLDELHLNSNSLTGSIPSELGNLSLLAELFLQTNLLSGQFPSMIGRLSSLQDLRITQNSVSGTIPTEIGFLSNLLNLDLINNFLTGTIPTEVGQLTDLEIVFTWGNCFTGTIPTEVGNLENLREWDTLNTFLSGTLPSELGRLTKLEFLNIRHNMFTGTMPTEFGLLLPTVTTAISMRGDLMNVIGNFDPIICKEEFGFDGVDNFRNIWSNCLLPEITCSCCIICCDREECMHRVTGDTFSNFDDDDYCTLG